MRWRWAVLVLGLCFPLLAGAEAQIKHKPSKAETPLVIRATITAKGGVLEATVNYRKSRGSFRSLKMDAAGGDAYEATIPAAFISNAGRLEYYLRAVSAEDLAETFWKSKSSPYRLTLEKKGGARKVHVTTTPTAAILDLDGVTVGPAPMKQKLDSGPHKIVARLTGYDDLTFGFNMPADHDLELPLTLKSESHADTTKQVRPIPSGKGRLRISTVPLGASITVDGSYEGMTPAEIDLTPDSHLVSTSRDGYRDESRVIQVQAGQVVEEVLKLREKGK